ncbi:CPBP family intramembrane metalloprotease [Jannaschia ovalis]|uniref:Lysostaphin resistance A-like protein n=1 Tax=Jannaschia ovalis TaxID=3038773 RepID=A0ABY8LDV5_9RHOB|nr:CPBP family intramembrane metalloprotease [Jannaschia sp. GRR-S6-38]WGH78573.1 lysostaphin resistance A-like protein [Jannaschia sp. GRR-S6-38]
MTNPGGDRHAQSAREIAVAAPSDLPTRTLWPFLALTFGITWGITGAYIFLPGPTTALFGPIGPTHPLFFIATWAPALAAVLLVARRCGRLGLGRFLSRLLRWRAPAGWTVFVLLGLPLVFVLGSLLKGGPLLAPRPPEGVGGMIALLGIMLLLGPVEELGWRGVLQPLLQRRLAPLASGLVIGTIWGLWHLPAFHLAGTLQSDWSFWPFFMGNVALAVLLTALLNASGGSLFWPVLFHWQLINPFWPDAQPWDTWLLVAIAAAMVWRDRERMLTRDSGVTEVVPRRPDART